tara:strand:+ start:3689 stop:5137 length:1449 start_codon:yes stop_codon:yes gene_type:complete
VSHFINFENSYAKELNEICEKFKPAGFPRSEILLKNYGLAEELGLDRKFIDSKECLNIFSGTSLPKSSNPIAQAYSGHQFGHFNPQLGDGRAILLGEIKNKDIQLKGIGQTPFSRRGDGKSALGPVLREYVISEFMHSINIPTTRSLSAIKTNEIVLRETEQPGGILTRVAKSHIRIGTFEYARCKNNEILKTLADYSINRHYPELKNTDNKYLSFFAAVCDKQAYLVSKWMSVGFVHGVMNTDNMAISGETIDYGPCAFMDRYNPRTVFSSIDHNGRYSYQNQPAILVWNLSKFAETLIPLINENREKSVKQLTEVLQLTMPSYQEYFYRDIGKKLGLLNINNRNIELINSYLKILESESIDFTLSFTDLSKVLIKEKNFNDSVFSSVKNFEDWYQNWIRELTIKNTEIKKLAKDMNSINPCYIPRNHIIEKALNNATNNDMSEINNLLEIFKNPFEKQDISEDYLTPSNSESPYVTFCGT